MANNPPRSGNLEVLVRQQWLSVNVALKDDCMTLAATDISDQNGSFVAGLGKVDVPDSIIGQRRSVKVIKDEQNGLGISIKGGRENRMPILVTKLYRSMSNEKTDKLYVGDAILSVNGEDLKDATHEDAVKALKKAGKVVELQVKYLKEATPYFKKTSILNEIEWGSAQDLAKREIGKVSPVETGKLNSPGIETLSLKRCYLCRNLTYPDSQKRTLELHSSDSNGICTFRFPDTATASDWFNAINSVITALTKQAIEDANKMLSSAGNPHEIRHMGWLSEQLTDDQGTTIWKRAFMVLLDNDLLLYDTVPVRKEDWATPFECLPLISTRFIHCGKQNSCLVGADFLTFGIRSGTSKGVEVHIFRVETQRDLICWSKAIVQGSHQAAIVTKQVSYSAVWKSKKAKLTIHFDKGFTLKEDQDTTEGVMEVLWARPFESLRTSSDDGQRLLWLDFDDVGEQELDLGICPKPAVFVIHTFLSAKLSRLGHIS